MEARFRTSTSRAARFTDDFARRQRGFSLLETLFVVAVFIIVVGIAVPSFLNASRYARIRNDSHALANLIVMARMRASTEFAHVEVACTTNATPPYCILESSPFPNATSFTVGSEPQKIYLSEGVSFGIPPVINTNVLNQPAAYQGDSAQGVTTSPVIVFNSRGWPVDAATGQNITTDYALYLQEGGNYAAVTVNQAGRPALYWWNTQTLAFTPLYEYSNTGYGTNQ